MTRCDNLPKYDRLWEDYVEEEDRIMAKSKETHEENQALATCWKGKKKRYFPKRNQGERLDNRNEGRSNNINDRRIDRRYERRSDKRDKIEDHILNLQGFNVLVEMDMVT